MTEAFTEDRLLGGRVVLRQPASGYRAAIDPVVLAAAVQAPPGAHVLDAGCGSGAAMFCLASRRPDLRITGVERNADVAALARAGVEINGFAGRLDIVDGDMAALPAAMANAFDVVMINPPFGADGTHSPHQGRAAANHEQDVNLVTWLRACLRCLKPGGRLVVIHRADRLSDVLAALHGRAGDIHVLPIHPKAGEPARRVIVDAGKGRKSLDTLLPGFVLHEADGRFTAAADAVLRNAAALAM
jgi:tRNA1(Val) A37 N6-methylase TrmN6